MSPGLLASVFDLIQMGPQNTDAGFGNTVVAYDDDAL